MSLQEKANGDDSQANARMLSVTVCWSLPRMQLEAGGLGQGERLMKRMCAVLLAGMVFSVTARAQAPERGERGPDKRRPGQSSKKTESSRDRLNRRFNESSPKIGELVPEVTGYTADGKPVSLRSLEGDYKVLVFGCLT